MKKNLLQKKNVVKKKNVVQIKKENVILKKKKIDVKNGKNFVHFFQNNLIVLLLKLIFLLWKVYYQNIYQLNKLI